jgi:hypothetical protein
VFELVAVIADRCLVLTEHSSSGWDEIIIDGDDSIAIGEEPPSIISNRECAAAAADVIVDIISGIDSFDAPNSNEDD